MLSAVQHDAFARHGVLHLPGAVPGPAVRRMRDRLWRYLLEKHGMTSDRPDTWRPGTVAHFQDLIRTGAFDPMATAEILGSVGALLGGRTWQRPEHWGRPLVTFPARGTPWRLPMSGWHLDSAGRAGDPLLVVFVCLAPVEPYGGGTLVVTGSHRLTGGAGRYAGIRSADVRPRLAGDHPWFRNLFGRGPEPDRTQRLIGSGVQVDGVELRIRQLTGAPGDTFFVDPRLLHAVAPNSLDTPRLMLLQFLGPAPA
jgi:hypothetical protein